MLFIDNEGNFPKYYGDILIQNPNWQIGDELPVGWQEVADALPPEIGEYQILLDGQPEIIEGVLTRTFLTRDMTDEEIAATQAPVTAREKLISLGFSDSEIFALSKGLV